MYKIFRGETALFFTMLLFSPEPHLEIILNEL